MSVLVTFAYNPPWREAALIAVACVNSCSAKQDGNPREYRAEGVLPTSSLGHCGLRQTRARL
jgi:hypothetical protein